MVLRALRRRWPGCQYVCLLEYTRGYAKHSEGRRRPHWNILLKGIPREDVAQAADIIRRVWCQHADARPRAQYVGEVDRGVAGLMRYVADHFHKEDQQPPEGFKGKRFNPSHGYWNGDLTAEQMREGARQSLTYYRLLKEANVKHGLRDAAADAWVVARMEEMAELDWTVIRTGEDRWGEPTVTVIGGKPLHIDREAL